MKSAVKLYKNHKLMKMSKLLIISYKNHYHLSPNIRLVQNLFLCRGVQFSFLKNIEELIPLTFQYGNAAFSIESTFAEVHVDIVNTQSNPG